MFIELFFHFKQVLTTWNLIVTLFSLPDVTKLDPQPFFCQTPSLEVINHFKELDYHIQIQTGYLANKPCSLQVIATKEDPNILIEITTAWWFQKMAQAAKVDHVRLSLNNSFRSYQEQQKLYQNYQRKVKGTHFALPPGFSPHQSGYAVDIRISSSKILRWLHRHAKEYHFYQTACDEVWHFEYSPSHEPLPFTWNCETHQPQLLTPK